jgi:DNA-binding CsgD family transcriptional regulator
LSNEYKAPVAANSTEQPQGALQKTNGSKPVTEPATEGSTFEGAMQRREIAAILLDAANSVAMANAAGLHHLRSLAPQGAVGPGRPLPDQIARLVSGLRDDLRRSGLRNASMLTLPTGLCLRASLLEGAPHQHLLLLVEPVLRLDERNLSRRELEVATLVLNGLSNREIAAKLVVAHHTVEGHLKRIFAKLQVRTRAGLVARMLGWQPEEHGDLRTSYPVVAATREQPGDEGSERSPDKAGRNVK